MAVKLIPALKTHGVVFVSIPAKAYASRFPMLAAEVSKAFGSTCAVSLEVPACRLAGKLMAAGVPKGKVLAVGMKKRGARGAKCAHSESCADSDGSIVDLTMALYRLVDTKKPKAVIIGPISALVKKNSEMDALKFINYVASDSRKAKRKFIAVCTKKDLTRACLKDFALFADKMLEEK